MPFALLLAMQAAGMVTDWFGTQNQQRMADMGSKLQQAGIQNNIEQTRLEAEDSSLEAMKNLRANLGSQLAVFAARGTSTGAGSAVSILTESVGNFNADERMRRMNLLGKENQLKAGGLISRLTNSSENSKLWQGFAQRSINRFPTTLAAWGGGSSTASKYGAQAKNYGLTQRNS